MSLQLSVFIQYEAETKYLKGHSVLQPRSQKNKSKQDSTNEDSPANKTHSNANQAPFKQSLQANTNFIDFANCHEDGVKNVETGDLLGLGSGDLKAVDWGISSGSKSQRITWTCQDYLGMLVIAFPLWILIL